MGKYKRNLGMGSFCRLMGKSFMQVYLFINNSEKKIVSQRHTSRKGFGVVNLF